MGMSQPTEVILLCEDQQHARFARLLLKLRGVSDRRIRAHISPLGQGDAKKWVNECYPGDLTAYRAKANHINNVLIVMSDADNNSVLQRAQQLENACDMNKISGRLPHERVIFVIPKWAIETWILSLTGSDIQEDNQITSHHKKLAFAKMTQAVTLLAKSCRGITGTKNNNFISSLFATCQEFDRVREYF
jgi:hypothetical protein